MILILQLHCERLEVQRQHRSEHDQGRDGHAVFQKLRKRHVDVALLEQFAPQQASQCARQRQIGRVVSAQD